MVELSGCKANNGVILLKLLNHFVIILKDNLI